MKISIIHFLSFLVIIKSDILLTLPRKNLDVKYLITLCFILLANLAFAQPTATATYNSLGLYWDGVGGLGIDCTLEYKEISASTWKKAQDLWWDARPATDLHGDEYRGSIVGLKAGTNYDIKFTLSTGETEIITASTWEETYDLPISETIIVNSQSSGFRITNGGSPSGYILYDGTGSTISGGNNTGVIIDADYIILRGLTITDVGQFGIELMSVNHVIIEECDISVWGTQDIGGFQTEDDCGIWSNKCGLNNITIQNCAIHHPRYDTNHWKEYNAAVQGCEPGADCHPEGANAIAFECQIDELIPTTGNYVIRNNRIYSDYQHMFNDGIGADNNFSYNGFPIRDSDIYGNKISHVWDDALEIEGGNMNVRVWENTLDSINIAFGLATTSIGPLYVFRNISKWGEAYPDKGNGWELFKLGTSNNQWNQGAMFLYHNTIRQPDNHGMGSGLWPTKATNTQRFITSRNNILDVLYTSIRTDADMSMPNSSFDYDLCSHVVPEGSEMNGILNTSPAYKAGSDILADGSVGIDDGKILWNFNDLDSAWPFTSIGPDIGAIESTPTPPAPILPIRVNVGGPEYISKTGDVFLQDQAFLANTSWGYTSTGTIENRAVVDILNTEDDDLYLTERWWNETEIGSYTFNIPDGSYNLRLHFVEYNEVDVGDVVFDVKAANKVILNDFDIRSEVAQYSALVKYVEGVSTIDGKLNIDFVGLSGSLGSKIMAIEILERTSSTDILPIRVNVGGPEYVSTAGDVFLQDQAFLTNNSWGYTSTGTAENRAVVDILNTEDDDLYLTERWWNETEIGSYTFNIPDGLYNVRLHFIEYNEVDVGDVVFDVKAANKVILNDFDIRSEVAQYSAIVKYVDGVSAIDGKLKIDFVGLSGSLGSKIMAIEILEMSMTNCPEIVNISENTSSGTYKASNLLVSNSIILPESPVTFIAGNSITLNPNFHAQAGSNFQAFIAPCTEFVPTNEELSLLQNAEHVLDNRPKKLANQRNQKRPFLKEGAIAIYPNPAVSSATISLESTQAKREIIFIVDITGRIIKTYDIVLIEGRNDWIFSLVGIPSGSYFVKVGAGIKSEWPVQKLVIVQK